MSAPLSQAQRAFRDAELNVFDPQFGIGGDQWTRTRSAGNGVSGPVTSGAPVIVTGYVSQVDKAQIGASAAGVGVVDIGWMFTGPLSVANEQGVLIAQDIRTGDVLTSVADATFVFTLTGKVEEAGYIAYLAEKGR